MTVHRHMVRTEYLADDRYRATCICGWTSIPTDIYEIAAHDADEHAQDMRDDSYHVLPRWNEE